MPSLRPTFPSGLGKGRWGGLSACAETSRPSHQAPAAGGGSWRAHSGLGAKQATRPGEGRRRWASITGCFGEDRPSRSLNCPAVAAPSPARGDPAVQWKEEGGGEPQPPKAPSLQRPP